MSELEKLIHLSMNVMIGMTIKLSSILMKPFGKRNKTFDFSIRRLSCAEAMDTCAVEQLLMANNFSIIIAFYDKIGEYVLYTRH